MLKRIIKNIKWSIFNHPPISFESFKPDERQCEFCKSHILLYSYGTINFTICQNCMAKAFRKILKIKNK